MKEKQSLWSRFKKFFDNFNENPTYTTLLVLCLATIIVVSLSISYYINDFNNFYEQILTEAHGMLFDIAIIGLLIFWLNNRGETKQRIRTYLDEIEDFRLWDSEESAFRTAGNIKRLNRHKIYDINLHDSHLAKTNMNGVKLTKANLNNANVNNSILSNSILDEARCNQTNFENCNLNQVSMVNIYANGANFRDSSLVQAKMDKAFFIRADFTNAILMNVNLQESELTEAVFDDANLYKADLRNTKGLTIQQLSRAKTFYRALLDEDIYAELKSKRPDLLEI